MSDMDHSPQLLVVDDDESIRFAVSRYFSGRGYACHQAEDLAQAFRLMEKTCFEAAIIDWSLPDGNGSELLHALRGFDDTLPVTILTGHGTIDLAVQALRDGAEHFLTKPVDLATLYSIVKRAIRARREHFITLAAKEKDRREAVNPFFGSSAAIHRLATSARRVAEASVPVLLYGETGSGKGLLARWLHDSGPRNSEAFVDLNCAGLPRDLLESELFGHARGAFTSAVSAKSGLFEYANCGTLFLDEIGDLPLELQPKLLKVVEEQVFRRLGEVKNRRTNVRLIAATHQDIERLSREGGFRADLYYRLSTVILRVPALRERGRDVVELAETLIPKLAMELRKPAPVLSSSAKEALLGYTWPGNIRELKNVLERAILMRDVRTLEAIDLDLGPIGLRAGPSEILTLQQAEHNYLEKTLRELGLSIGEAAPVLGISRSALYEKLRRHGIQIPRARKSGNPE